MPIEVTMVPSRRSCVLAAVTSLVLGCSGLEATDPAQMSAVPAPPNLAPGMAMLQGRVLAWDAQPIAGATVTVLDTPALKAPNRATTDASGAWQLVVDGDTTVALQANAEGHAPTYSNAVIVPTGQSSANMELMLLRTDRIDALNNMMGGARVAEYGVIAVEVRSLGGVCDPTGGKISLHPSPFGRVFYGKANEAMPDMSLTSMQAGARPAGWVLGVLPSGAYYRVSFEKAGCTQKTGAIVFEGRSYNGKLPVGSKALSHGLVFVD